MMCLCGLWLPLACVDGFRCPVKSTVVLVFVLFCPCLVCDRFLVIGSGFVGLVWFGLVSFILGFSRVLRSYRVRALNARGQSMHATAISSQF